MIATAEMTTDYTPRYASCDAALRIAGATCTFISGSGSRYFNLTDGRRVRVSEHNATPLSGPLKEEYRWAAEIRVDSPRWREQLLALTGKPEAGAVDLPSSVYFADYSAVSQSMLKKFADRRRLYEGHYVTGTIPEEPDSDPMRKGTATHTALLEPQRFESIVLTYPAELLAKKNGKVSADGAVSTDAAKEFRDKHEAAGHVVLKEKDAVAVRAMADSVRRVCSEWFDLPSMKERAVYWTDQETGLRLKLRLDWLIQHGSRGTVFDIKTTGNSSPWEFRKRVEQQKYWMQTAHYIEGVKAAFGLSEVEFYFVVVETEPPYTPAVYPLDHPSLCSAFVARRRYLNQLAACLESGDFSEPWEQRLLPLPLRDFCFEESF